MTYKKFVFLSILIPLPIIFALGILLYVYDPLRLYHKPWFRDDTYYSDIRLQAKSIIDNNDFDSVIIGSSMLENTSAKEASEKLGNIYLNLSLSGSSFHERKIIIDYILKNKNIKNIIFSMDGYIINKNSKNKKTDSFDFLYDGNLYNDFNIYINKHFIFCALVFSKDKKCIGEKINLEDYNKWYKKYKENFGGFDNWIKNKRFREEVVQHIKKDNFKTDCYINIEIDDDKEYLKKNLIELVKTNRDINFYLIIPAYHRVLYKMDEYTTYFKKDAKFYFLKYAKVIKHLTNEIKKYPNVKIYGFDDLDYADDIANYKDPVHYNIDMNSMQLDAIKNNTHILTIENIDEYFKIMEEKIISYDLQPIIEKINKNK